MNMSSRQTKNQSILTATTAITVDNKPKPNRTQNSVESKKSINLCPVVSLGQTHLHSWIV